MDRSLLRVAADNFDDAGGRTGPQQMGLICLGLEQMARGARRGSRDSGLMEVAASNFEDAGNLTGPDQMQRICLGLEQFARAL